MSVELIVFSQELAFKQQLVERNQETISQWPFSKADQKIGYLKNGLWKDKLATRGIVAGLAQNRWELALVQNKVSLEKISEKTFLTIN